MIIEQQIEYLTKGAVDVVPRDELRKKLESGKKLKVKVGFDPSAPDIHLGHTVLMRKMKHFQDLGHDVVFLIGDFTGLIGDPTGKSQTRPALTRDEILENAETYKQQVFKILDPKRTTVAFNSSWLSELGSEGFVRLASFYNVARMLERDDFKKRYQSNQPIAIHEFLYPLAQAYDSVFLKVDFELGGTDQLFNLLVGRDIMRAYQLEPQVVLTTPLLEGLDGVEKMSKSLNNYVGVTDPPEEMFGKLMSISDELMWRYYELLTDSSKEEIDALKGSDDPMFAKMSLARALVADFHSAGDATDAQSHFDQVVRGKEIPRNIPEKVLSRERVLLSRLLTDVHLATSRTDAQRLIQQGAVSIDGERIVSEIELLAPKEFVLRVGKRRYVKVSLR